jgi:outer membrane protein
VPTDIPNRPLTATEAAQIALIHQPNVAIAQEGVVAAKGNQEQAASRQNPALVVSAGYSGVGPNPTNTTGAATGLSANGYSASGTVDQLLFDFNHTRETVRQAVEETRFSMATLTKTQSDTVFQVKQGFYAYLQAEHLVSVNESNLRNQQSHLALAQARLKAGVGLPSDVVRAETAVSDAVFSLNLAQNTAAISRVSLAVLIGIDPRTPIQAAESDEPAAPATNLDDLVQLGLTNRPEIAQAEANIKASRHGLSAAKTSNSPAIIADAGWGGRGTVISMDQSGAFFAGVELAFDPFDGGLTAGKVKQAKANLQIADQGMTLSQQGVISDVSQAYLNMKTAEQRVTTAEAEVANANESERLAEGRYKSGLGTFLDVLDAQAAEVTADTNRVNAIAAVDQARAALSHAIGNGL